MDLVNVLWDLLGYLSYSVLCSSWLENRPLDFLVDMNGSLNDLFNIIVDFLFVDLLNLFVDELFYEAWLLNDVLYFFLYDMLDFCLYDFLYRIVNEVLNDDFFLNNSLHWFLHDDLVGLLDLDPSYDRSLNYDVVFLLDDVGVKIGALF